MSGSNRRRDSSGVGLNREPEKPPAQSTRSKAALTQEDPSQSQTIQQDSHSRPMTRQGRHQEDRSGHVSQIDETLNTDYLHLQGDNLDTNLSSPVEEEDLSPRKQGKAKDPGRRYLLEPGDEERIILVDASGEARNPIRELDQETIVAYTQSKPWVMQNAISNTLAELGRVNQQNELWRRRVLEDVTKFENVQARLQDAEARVRELNDPRDEDEVRRLSRENTKLARELSELKRQIHSQGGRQHMSMRPTQQGTSTMPMGDQQNAFTNPHTQFQTSYQFGQNRRPQYPAGGEFTQPPSNQQVQSNPFGTGELRRAVTESQEGKYKGPGFFHGTHDADDFEAWRMGVDSVFRNAPILYSSNQRRIDFIRDNTKGTAFNIIKGRADPRSGFPYESSDEAMQDLMDVFGEQDPYGKANAELHSQAFRMGHKNPKETFPEFYARFITVTSNLRMTDRDKIESLKRNLSRRLLFKVSGILTESFSTYAATVRRIDQDVRNADEIVARQTTQYPQSKTGFRTKSSNDTPKYSAKNASPKSDTFPKAKDGARGINVPSHILRTLRKKGQCFKCLKEGHRHNDDDAPCKDKDWPTRDKLKTGLAAIDIDWNGEEDVDPYSDPDEESSSENDQSLT